MPILADCCTSETSVSCFVSLLEVSTSPYSESITLATTRSTRSASIRVTPRCARSLDSLDIGRPPEERLCRLPQPGEGPLGGADGHGHELDGVGGSCRDRCDERVELLDGIAAGVRIDIPAVCSQRRASLVRGRPADRPRGRVVPRRKIVGVSTF